MSDARNDSHETLREPGLPTGRGKRFLRQYELVERVLAYQSDANEDALNRAYVYAMVKHGSQKRHSGDPYYAHPVSVAGLLTDLRLDENTIIAGLLHDVVEDTDVTLDELEEQFGSDVAELVDGVTKLTQLEHLTQEAKQAENFQKFILATTRDIRVLLVKLADRLHNMRTIGFMPKPASRLRISRETIDIYAPLARRCGLSIFAAELEDLAFEVINPEAREAIEKHLSSIVQDSTDDLLRIQQDVQEAMKYGGIEGELRGRLKRPYSIWRKLETKAVSFQDLGDIFAFRFIVGSIEDCYRALGIAHQTWAVIAGRFKDYISVPKANGYQSLHTTFRGPGNRRIELQIRTRDMDEMAERGVAAHWRYKDKSYGFDAEAARAAGLDADATLQSIADLLKHEADPEEFLEHAKLEMYRDTVFAFTPKGKLIKLSAGATALDFAYAVHTEIGDTCVGVVINGVERPLRRPIENGDVVEVIRGKRVAPPANWQSLAVTGRARSAIRRLIREREEDEMEALGKHVLRRGLRRIGMDPLEIGFAELAAKGGYENVRELLLALGRGRLSVVDFLREIFPDIDEEKIQSRHLISDDETSSLVAGVELTPGVTLHLSECCCPIPGDRIVGVHRPDKGVEVHVIDCARLEDYDDNPELWVDLRWRMEESKDLVALTRLNVNMMNERGALATVCKTISEASGNIVNVLIRSRMSEFFEFQFDIEVEDTKRLTQIIAALRVLAVVESVDRIRGEHKTPEEAI